MKIIHKKGFCVAVLFIVAVVWAMLYPPVFYLNDDVAMRSILSGAYTGTPNGHAVYMQYPLTGVLAVLYRILGFVPWLELFFTASIFVCMLFFAEEFENRLQGILLAIVIFIPFILYMHYTLVAALLAATAILLLIKGDVGIRSGVLLVLAFWVRSQVGLLSLPFVLCALVFRVLSVPKQENKKEYLALGKWCAGVIACMLLCSLMHGICYSSAEWKEYNVYNESRTMLYDYTDFLSTGFYGEHCEAYGMNSTEYDILFSYNNMLDSSLDAEKIQEIAEKVSAGTEESMFAISALKKSIYQYYLHVRYNDRTYSVLWVSLVIVAAGICVWQKKWLQLAVLGVLETGRSLIWIYLIWKGRFPERVSHTLYLVEIFLLIGMIQKLLSEWKWTGTRRRVSGWIFIALLSITFALRWGSILQEVNNRHEIQKDWEELKTYCAKREETYFWTDVFSVVAYAENQYSKEPGNMRLMGGWLSASPLTTEVLEQIGVTDVAEALYDGKDVKLLVRKDKDILWLEDYLQSRFGPCELVIDEEILLQSGECFFVYEVHTADEILE